MTCLDGRTAEGSLCETPIPGVPIGTQAVEKSGEELDGVDQTDAIPLQQSKQTFSVID